MGKERYKLGEYSILEYLQVDSTNNEAERLATSDIEDKTVILASFQSGGRGQKGCSWESESGKNLLFTILYRPYQFPAEQQFAFSMVISLGVHDFLSRYLRDCTIKWPNDIYVGEKKIAGILIEHSVIGATLLYSLCGIGLNINQEKFLSDAPNPISMIELLGYELSLTQILKELLDAIDKRYDQLHDLDSLKRSYMAVLYRREGVYNWKDSEGNFRASIAGINQYGQLMLQIPSDKSDKNKSDKSIEAAKVAEVSSVVPKEASKPKKAESPGRTKNLNLCTLPPRSILQPTNIQQSEKDNSTKSNKIKVYSFKEVIYVPS